MAKQAEIKFKKAGGMFKAKRPGCEGAVFVPDKDISRARGRLKGYAFHRHSLCVYRTEIGGSEQPAQSRFRYLPLS